MSLGKSAEGSQNRGRILLDWPRSQLFLLLLGSWVSRVSRAGVGGGNDPRVFEVYFSNY